jgi:acetylornithine deacetylase
MPIHFAFSYDEEVGCLGVRRLLDVLAGIEPKPRFCIVGEPTSLQVVTAHKGKLGTEVTATGREAHSALAPQAVNAIHLVIDLIQEIRAIQAEIAEGERQDPAYEVPYTTLHVGRISGGETINIVPNHARFAFEIRYVPGDDPERLMDRIRAKADQIAAAARTRHAGAGFTFKPLQSYPPLDTPPDSAVVSFVQQLAQTNSTGKISFGTEGGLFDQRLGIPTVVCGPGSIAVAHKPDEYIELSQLAACDRFLERLIAALSR